MSTSGGLLSIYIFLVFSLLFIEDFTSYTYQIRLDGSLYTVGDKISGEGRHILCVEATDSAGNKAQAKAGFVIDRTPPRILFLDVEEEGVRTVLFSYSPFFFHKHLLDWLHSFL